MTTRILILGATGYIGGSILTELIAQNTDGKKYTLSALVRKPEQASILQKLGVNASVFRDLADIESIRKAAGENDLIIAAADARHAESAKACITGLADRSRSTGQKTSYIHTAGTSMVADWPVLGERIDTSIHSDVDEDIFQSEKDNPEPWSDVRKVNQVVVKLGEDFGVNIYIVAPPMIFGFGTGLFTTGFGQIHMLAELSLEHKQAIILGNGSGIWSVIHIKDLSKMYYLLVQAVIERNSALPNGKKGYYFAENGSHSWKSIAEEIGKFGNENGVFKTDKVITIHMYEVADKYFNRDIRHAESVLGSNSRTKADLARKVLGWEPKYGDDVFFQQVRDDIATMIKSRS
ncbi:hypothetical protein HYFRA_00006857 [Hymenoscyphus fraxineus]|uniref:NmrA-like domain-containing protein n=1 Tax=Hymenoscyphus fraxineus TaxID=746836 RepID=A0A9N9KN38_9HELO|nr:hypothetical protein HYFRA_00006857 [Hymenoscyphus fraxineus]